MAVVNSRRASTNEVRLQPGLRGQGYGITPNWKFMRGVTKVVGHF